MSFDISSSARVLSLMEDIEKMTSDDNVRGRMARFSYWRIFPGRNGERYRLLRRGQFGFFGDKGFYLTNLVLQGGGTLGLAHAGFVAGLEHAGFRFPAVAGTSAGAIVAMGLFAMRGDDILAPVGKQITDLVSEVPMDSFVDGPRPIRRLIKHLAANRSVKHPLFLSGMIAALRRLWRVRGLNTGAVFERWMDEVLASAKFNKIENLKSAMDTISSDLKAATNGKARPFGDNVEAENVLKLITTAMPTGMKFALPRDMRLLHREYDQITPARLVRMSMSIPLFFEPCVLRTNSETWSDHVMEKFEMFVTDRSARDMAELTELFFLDGGLFSNLPTDELVDGMPDEIASLSVPLVSDTDKVVIRNTRSLSGVVADIGAVANAVRMQRDRDAHSRIVDSGKKNRKIVKIDTGQSHWLNFTMNSAEKEDLYVAGLTRARDFLQTGA